MQTSFIKFTTQTGAQQASRLLNAQGIRNSVKRNPNPNHKEGCSYALFTDGDVMKALRLIEAAGIRHNGTESMRERP